MICGVGTLVRISSAIMVCLLSTRILAGEPDCAVGVRDGGKIVEQYGVGIYDVGSLAKPIVALAVMLAVRDGKLTLEDDVRRWIPELPKYDRSIKIRHLLSHTSGLRDVDSMLGLMGRSGATAAEWVHILARQRRLNHRPGSAVSYTNSGYVLASVVVQRAEGQPFDRFVSQRIFVPLGLKHSHFQDGVWTMTLSDVLSLDQALDAGRVLGIETRTLFASAMLDDGQSIPFTVGGWKRSSYRGLETVEKDGIHGRWIADWVRWPKLHLSVVALCGDHSPAQLISRRVADPYLNRAGAPPAGEVKRQVVAVGKEELSSLVGLYVGEGADLLRVERRGDVLWAAPPPFPLLRLEAIGKHPLRFAVIGLPEPAYVEFEPQPSGSWRLRASDSEGTWTAARGRTELLLPATAFAGDYHSPELGVTYHLREDKGTVTVQLATEPPDKLIRVSDRIFVDGPVVFRFAAVQGRVTGFSLSRRRALHIDFTRVP